MKTSAPVLFDKLSYPSFKEKRFSFWQSALSRDVENLLNEASHSARLDLKMYPYVENSVLNLGYSVFSESMPINTDPVILAQKITKILSVFESRLDPNSIKVTPVVDQSNNQILSILFDIHALSYINGEEVILNLRIALDYSCGIVKII